MEWSIGCDNFDDKKVIDIAPESCNIPKISLNPEDCDCVNNNKTYLDLQDNTDDKAEYQPQNAMDDIQIEHKVYCDSYNGGDFAYRIIDTFNVYEEDSVKQEGQNIPQNTEKSLKIRHQNDHTQTQIKVEVDNQVDIESDLVYTKNNQLIACSKKDISLEKYDVDYNTVHLKDDLNKNIDEQLQNKGM